MPESSRELDLVLSLIQELRTDHRVMVAADERAHDKLIALFESTVKTLREQIERLEARINELSEWRSRAIGYGVGVAGAVTAILESIKLLWHR